MLGLHLVLVTLYMRLTNNTKKDKIEWTTHNKFILCSGVYNLDVV